MRALKLMAPPRQVCGDSPEVLTEVLHDGVNLAVWQRTLSQEVSEFTAALVACGRPLADSLSLEITDAEPELHHLASEFSNLPGYAAFIADVSWLLQAYACLLDARRVGLRLRLLDKAMCPRFHVDRVPLRLVTTYVGAGSQWLADTPLARLQLSNLALEVAEDMIHSMRTGDVALLKGERWEGNEHGAIIHRSPPVSDDERRLLLTLDWLE
ncbi:DUF1826 domain-containing protein [Pseudomonas sp. NW5]|uniref:DUF1826 domain-containing protein n=1 Tax=Pseudomonas sp. NW5 TaxID=2934934 RepID=UPI00201FF04D|nr:DUF1826 domain-containing protein [Pseudomonas sp. NW5]MCL7462920.1 DUF1826 domain-containing protein [Pseudomonas sp. NW5]